MEQKRYQPRVWRELSDAVAAHRSFVVSYFDHFGPKQTLRPRDEWEIFEEVLVPALLYSHSVHVFAWDRSTFQRELATGNLSMSGRSARINMAQVPSRQVSSLFIGSEGLRPTVALNFAGNPFAEDSFIHKLKDPTSISNIGSVGAKGAFNWVRRWTAEAPNHWAMIIPSNTRLDTFVVFFAAEASSEVLSNILTIGHSPKYRENYCVDFEQGS
jgi:hypothetical protein